MQRLAAAHVAADLQSEGEATARWICELLLAVRIKLHAQGFRGNSHVESAWEASGFLLKAARAISGFRLCQPLSVMHLPGQGA